MVHPLLAAGRFQPPGKTEEFGLRHNIPGGGAPDIVELSGQLRTDPKRTSLLQHPADIGGDVPGKTALSLCVGEPADKKQVLLLLRPDEPILAGQTKGNQGTPGQVRGFFVFSVNRHSGPDNVIRPELYAGFEGQPYENVR